MKTWEDVFKKKKKGQWNLSLLNKFHMSLKLETLRVNWIYWYVFPGVQNFHCRLVECFHQMGNVVPCTSAEIDLQRPCSTKAVLEAFKLHCQVFCRGIDFLFPLCSYNTAWRGSGGAGIWGAECRVMDAFYCLCTFTIAFSDVLTGCGSRFLCSFVFNKLSPFWSEDKKSA